MKNLSVVFGALALAVSALGQSTQPAPPTAELPNETRPAPETQATAHSPAPDKTQSSVGQRKTGAMDRQLMAKIRKSVVADKGLSTYAHNVKITSQQGVVTLKGRVRSDDEANSITAKAAEATGSPDKVVNQMTVKP